MNILIRWYNQNRRIIWTALIVIVLVIGITQALNNYYKNNTNEGSSSVNISTTTYNTINNTSGTITSGSSSVISQEQIDINIAKNSEELIENFFNYCNNNNLEEAYGLLSEDCKQELYPTIDKFKQRYFDILFTQKRTYTGILWISNYNKNTYRLEIYGDILASGKKDEMPVEEYYTVSYENGKYALNIKGYIGKENINISKVQDDIEITIVSKKVYMDYEEYLIKVKNNSKNNLILNAKENVNSLYLEDENHVQYKAFLNEVLDYDLNIKSGFTNEINIKFNRTYKPNVEIRKMVFDAMKIGQDDENKKLEINI